MSLAEDLVRSIATYCSHYETCVQWMNMEGLGRDFFVEVMGKSYDFFSEHINGGPVILLDADCELVSRFEIPGGDWDIAAVNRGPCSNSYGKQDYLSTIVMFNSLRPNLVRSFWLCWCTMMMKWALGPEELVQPKGAGVRNDRLEAGGWARTWFADQTSLNMTIDRFKADCPSLTFLDLSRDVHAADHVTSVAEIVHKKGGRKLCQQT